MINFENFIKTIIFIFYILINFKKIEKIQWSKKKINENTFKKSITCRQKGQVFSFIFSIQESHRVCRHGMYKTETKFMQFNFSSKKRLLAVSNNLIVFLWAFNVFFQIALENCSSTRWPLKTLQLSPIRSLVVTNWLFGPLRHLALHLLLPLFVFLLPI